MKVTLTQARENAGLTVNQAAEKIKVKPVTLKAWESGKHHPRGFMLNRIARAYGLQIADIYFMSGRGRTTFINKVMNDEVALREKLPKLACPYQLDYTAASICDTLPSDMWPDDDMCRRCWRQEVEQ